MRTRIIGARSRIWNRTSAETQRKVNDLQKGKDSGQQFILSPEQQQELVNFRKTEADVKVQLKDMRKKLRAEIDSLETKTKWINMAAMPPR